MQSTLTEDEAAQCELELKIQGWTVIPRRLSISLVAALLERFDQLIERRVAGEPFNRGPQRIQMYLPWERPFDDTALWAHPDVLAVVRRLLGPDPALVYHASDTPLPGSEHQAVHSDTQLLFPEEFHSLPAYGVAVNVPLVDCSEENGSLEFWPGTHRIPLRPHGDAPTALLPSLRANIPAGSILVRDLRMWHRGAPNHSHRSRPHLAMVYARSWYRFEQDPPVVPARALEGLSDEHRRLLRYASIAG